MSRENVDLVRRIYEAEGDLTRLAELRWAYAADFELREVSSMPEAETLRGPDAVERWVRKVLAFFDHFSYVPREIHDAGERVLVEAVVHGRGKESGAETEVTAYNLWTFRDGKLCSLDNYFDREEALEAAGLSE